ncbi:hypothetical protein FDP41_007250 [Naegleria fowleri]|uniref:Mitochondrial pyruvate carrier n=1 Tax=Naegleria fowleri TaxID=5763 RepID=A0A6A5B574_NAEFO|nr:uncharacterized protein FDP41_007250 [Naegleria fowleri]KAF0973863.1 hypothetical protein FDP41_007250 [Naegleria fowleri]
MLRKLLVQFWNSPVGPKTTHFWGPFANWGIVIAAIMDYDRPPEKVSGPMTFALCCYSGIFMRFAWVVKPRNLLMLSMHVVNEIIQLYHLTRKISYEMNKKNQVPKAEASSDEK